MDSVWIVFESMDLSKKMKMLIVSNRFGMDRVPSSNHITDRVQALLSRGAQIVLICATQHNRAQFSSYGKQIEIHFIDPCDYSKYFIQRKYETLKRRIWYQLCGGPDALLNSYGWENQAITYLSKNVDLSLFDICYSTGGPTNAHLIGRWVSQYAGIPWLAEVQDPIVHNYAASHITRCFKKRLAKVEKLLSKADVLLTLTENCHRHYVSKYGWEHVTSLYPGTSVHLTAAVSETKKASSEKLTLFHAGSLGNTRNLEVLVEGVLALRLEGQIEISIAGDIDAATHRLIDEHDFLHYVGQLSRMEVHKRLLDTHLALVIQHREFISTLTIPSKYYDYAALGVPILFLGYQNDEVRANAAMHGFYYADQSDPQEVRAVLWHLVAVEKSHRRPTLPFNLESSTEEFLAVCRQAIVRHQQRAKLQPV